MFAILRGANGRRHEVDSKDDPVIVDVSMSTATVQITMTPPRQSRHAPLRHRYVATRGAGVRDGGSSRSSRPQR
jgi:hypothetical protein